MKVTQTQKNNKTSFVVHVPEWTGGGRRYFKTATKARQFIRSIDLRAGREIARIKGLSDEDIMKISKALEVAKTPDQLLKMVIEHEKLGSTPITKVQEKTLLEIVPLWEASMTGRNAEEGGKKVRAFCAAEIDKITFGSKVPSQITGPNLVNYIEGLDVAPITKRNTQVYLNSFFNWAVSHGHASVNPLKGVKLPPADRKDPIEFYTPEEMTLILNECIRKNDRAMITFVVLSGFGGMGTTEILRRDWTTIDLKKNPALITITKNFGLLPEIEENKALKDPARNRDIPAQANLDAWLRWLSGTGPLCPLEERTITARFKTIAAATGVKRKNNGLRHSATSYYYAKYQDAGKTAAFLGHADTKMIFSNYRRRVSEEAAEKWFSIFPPDGRV